MAPPSLKSGDLSQSIFLDPKQQAFIKWASTPQAAKISEAAKQKVWKPFLSKYPYSDKTKICCTG